MLSLYVSEHLRVKSAVGLSRLGLKVTGLKRGSLLNFGAARLVDGIQRVTLCPLWQGFFLRKARSQAA